MRPDSVAGGLACIVAALGLLSASYLSLMVPWSAVEYGVCRQVSFAIEPRALCNHALAPAAGGGTRGGAAAAVASPSGDGQGSGSAGGTEGVDGGPVATGLASGSAVHGRGDDDGGDLSCHRLRLQVVMVPRVGDELDDLASFPASVVPPGAAACPTSSDCMQVLQEMNATFPCYVEPPMQMDDGGASGESESGPPSVIVGQAPPELTSGATPGWKAKTAFGFLVFVPIPFCLLMGVCLVYSGVTESNPLASFMARYSCDMKAPGAKHGPHVL